MNGKLLHEAVDRRDEVLEPGFLFRLDDVLAKARRLALRLGKVGRKAALELRRGVVALLGEGDDGGLGLVEMRALNLELMLLLDKLFLGFEIGELGDELLADQSPVNLGLLQEQRDGGFKFGDSRLAGCGLRLLLRFLPVERCDFGPALLALGEKVVPLGRKQVRRGA